MNLFNPVRTFQHGILLLFVFYLILAGFKKQDRTNTQEYPVRFKFIHMVDNDTLAIDTIKYLNKFGNKYSVSTLKYFISDIYLYNSKGDSLLLNETHFIDVQNRKTSDFLSDYKVPNGFYAQISIHIGLDKTKNVPGKFPNPPENRMEWPETMGGGYHYMKLEGKIDSAGEIRNYQAHTGQLNGTPYYIHVVLPASHFTIDNKGVEIQIIMDINEWWRSPNTLDLNNITAIMDNSLVQKQLMENGPEVFSLGSIQ